MSAAGGRDQPEQRRLVGELSCPEPAGRCAPGGGELRLHAERSDERQECAEDPTSIAAIKVLQALRAGPTDQEGQLAGQQQPDGGESPHEPGRIQAEQQHEAGTKLLSVIRGRPAAAQNGAPASAAHSTIAASFQ